MVGPSFSCFYDHVLLLDRLFFSLLIQKLIIQINPNIFNK